MVTVIISARNPVPESTLERNIRKTAGAPIELFIINNAAGTNGLASVYNFGAARSRGDVLVFMHDDAFFMTENWAPILEGVFAQDPRIGVAGVAGTQYLHSDNPSWTAAGQPFIQGRIVHDLQNGDFFATLFSQEREMADVVACSGVFFAVRRTLLTQFGFDAAAFGGFSFHDLDFCMQARKTWRVVVTSDILIKHRSTGTYDKEWQRYGQVFLQKWAGLLPASCTNMIPNPERVVPAVNANLKGKIEQRTIA
ncbi:MAG: glycosyltransferase family protein [Chitinispirillia bacterium]|nr:glycosyltransferase family protein [Chitinispirillia bacterium]MCL2241520.1 glycosyltransferase family protein [Chitinispirillia bacterium]